MHFLNYFYKKTLKFDFIHKFHYTHLKKLPKLKKVVLNVGCQTTELKVLATHLLALELVVKQKGILTTSKQSNILLKIRKGSPVGCSVRLKKGLVWHFFSKTFTEIFPKIKSFEGTTSIQKIKSTGISFTIKNSLNFSELTEHYHLFSNLSKLNVSIAMDVTTKEEMIFLMNSLQLVLKKQLSKANITQLVECNLAKVKVKGSSPFICS